MKYLTSAPVMAALFLGAIAFILITLNLTYPGLQYGTYFHALP